MNIAATFVCGFPFAAILNTLPIADAAKYRKAVEDCEKSLPRNKHCKVVRVPE